MNNDEIDSFLYSIKGLGIAMRQIGNTAIQVTNAILELSRAINDYIPKEIKIMMNKLTLMKARLQTLEGRNTDCEAIRKKLRRQIRNLEAAIAA